MSNGELRSYEVTVKSHFVGSGYPFSRRWCYSLGEDLVLRVENSRLATFWWITRIWICPKLIQTWGLVKNEDPLFDLEVDYPSWSTCNIPKQWGLQELAKHGLPRGCAEHNLLLMMQAQWSARACTWKRMAQPWPEWQTFGRSWICRNIYGNFGRTPQTPWVNHWTPPGRNLAPSMPSSHHSQVFSEFKGELGGSEMASFQGSHLFSARIYGSLWVQLMFFPRATKAAEAEEIGRCRATISRGLDL